MDEHKWIGCRFDVGEEHFDWMEKTIKEYTLGEYVIAFEMSKKAHYHILMEGSDKIYRNMSKKIKEKFNLNANGKKHEYRKEPNIRDKEQYNIYILKDGNYRSNMSEDRLRDLYNQSYQKRDDNPVNLKIAQEIKDKKYKIPNWRYNKLSDTWSGDASFEFMKMTKLIIIEKLLKNKGPINKCRVNRIYQLYIELLYEDQDEQSYDHIDYAQLIYNNIY